MLKLVLSECLIFSFSMSEEEALGRAGEAHVVAVVDRIQGLEQQLARLTQMVQTRVKLEIVGVEDQQSVKMP